MLAESQYVGVGVFSLIGKVVVPITIEDINSMGKGYQPGRLSRGKAMLFKKPVLHANTAKWFSTITQDQINTYVETKCQELNYAKTPSNTNLKFLALVYGDPDKINSHNSDLAIKIHNAFTDSLQVTMSRARMMGARSVDLALSDVSLSMLQAIATHESQNKRVTFGLNVIVPRPTF